MSLEENKAIVRRGVEAVNRQDLASLEDLVTPDYLQYIASHFKTFPDFHQTIEDIIAEGDKVWVYLKTTGTHKGESRGLAPTGRKIAYAGVQMWHIVDGKVVEGKGVYDSLDTFRELGIIEYTKEGKKLFPEDVS